MAGFGRKWLKLNALTSLQVVIQQMLEKNIIVDNDGIWQSIVNDFKDDNLEKVFSITTISKKLCSDSLLVWEFGLKCSVLVLMLLLFCLFLLFANFYCFLLFVLKCAK